MQYSRFRKMILPVILCLTTTAAAFAVPVDAAPREKAERRHMFKLRVQFGYPWKERVEINISISPNVTFAGNATDKEGHRYKIGGMLLPRTKGKYRVILTTLSWGWDVFGESFGTLAPDLELNRTVTVCSSDGIIHDCIATTLSLLTDEKAKP